MVRVSCSALSVGHSAKSREDRKGQTVQQKKNIKLLAIFNPANFQKASQSPSVDKIRTKQNVNNNVTDRTNFFHA